MFVMSQVTYGLTVAVYLVSVVTPSIWGPIQIIGATAGAVIGFLIPGMSILSVHFSLPAAAFRASFCIALSSQYANQLVNLLNRPFTCISGTKAMDWNVHHFAGLLAFRRIEGLLASDEDGLQNHGPGIKASWKLTSPIGWMLVAMAIIQCITGVATQLLTAN